MPNKTNKIKKLKTIRILDENDRIVETDMVGIPTVFQPGEWDIAEELENNEALREFLREGEEL